MPPSTPRALPGGAASPGATIAAKSAFASARVVARSFTEDHPGIPFFVLLADEVDGYFDPAQEEYELLLLRELDGPDAARLRFALTEQQVSYAQRLT
jgi:hypothetical protein